MSSFQYKPKILNIYSCPLFLSTVSSFHSPLVLQLRQSLRAMYRSIVSPNFGMITSLLPHEHLMYLANIIQSSWCLLKIINNFWWAQIGNDRRCRWTHHFFPYCILDSVIGVCRSSPISLCIFKKLNPFSVVL